MAFADCIDTFYTYVSTRIKSYNSARGIFGVMDAADWPPKPVEFQSFYLIYQGFNKLNRETDSAAIEVVSHHVAWMWLILGTDLNTGLIGRNRGDRYRTNQQMLEELRYGLFPRFTQKKSFSVLPNTNPPQLTSVPVTPNGVGSTVSIIWQDPQVRTQFSKGNGAYQTVATMRITDFLDPITS